MAYVRYKYTSASPTSSASPDYAYTHYTPHHKTQTASPSRRPSTRHSRRESYSSPHQSAGWESPPVYPSPEYYASLPKPRSRRFTGTGYSAGGHGGDSQRHGHYQSQRIIDTSDEAEDLPTYTYIKPRTSHREQHARPEPHFYNNHSSSYEDSCDSLPPPPRARRSSHSTKPAKAATKPKPTTYPRVATADDAAYAGIKAGYSIKNWDPTEAPILLLGSVFDANSLGKWVYDWTVSRHKAGMPIPEVAGELWLLMIKLQGKMKRADECLPRIRSRHDEEVVGEFLDSGDRLWGRLARLLQACEPYMLEAAAEEKAEEGKKRGKNSAVVTGKRTGYAFVDAIFGRDKQLKTTENLMQGIRLWEMRFDANCEDILTYYSQRSRRS